MCILMYNVIGAVNARFGWYVVECCNGCTDDKQLTATLSWIIWPIALIVLIVFWLGGDTPARLFFNKIGKFITRSDY